MNRDGHLALGPVAIGGVGGSGTRLVAQILREAGFYLGSDLNSENDNLWFTLLFKRPRWFRKASQQDVARGLELFRKVMTHDALPSVRELRFLAGAVMEVARHGHDPRGRGRGRWPFVRAGRMWARKPTSGRLAAWGWKAPNSHIYMTHLYDAYPDLKYIHVIRHGIDLAYSSNEQQALIWGWLYGLQIGPPPVSAKDRLEYWIRANQRSVEAGAAAGPGRFLLLNFDQLCAEPQQQITALLDFLGAKVEPETFAAICKLPKTPVTKDRYRTQNLSVFDSKQIEAVRDFGFQVAV
jgi:hypothetical protein